MSAARFGFVALLVCGWGCSSVPATTNGACVLAADCEDDRLCVDSRCAAIPTTGQGGLYRDPVSMLVWQGTAPTVAMSWDSAKRYCAKLTQDGGGWHLPDIEELRSLVRDCPASELGGACAATNMCLIYDTCLTDCGGCADGPQLGPEGVCFWPDGLEGPCTWYWASTVLDQSPAGSGGAWYIDFSYGHVCGRSQDFTFGQVRCVRQR